MVKLLRFAKISKNRKSFPLEFFDVYSSCNMAMRDLSDMYTQNPRAVGQRAEGIHIRQITNGHVTSIMYHFVSIVTTPVV